jgi:hypothetical protein
MEIPMEVEMQSRAHAARRNEIPWRFSEAGDLRDMYDHATA